MVDRLLGGAVGAIGRQFERIMGAGFDAPDALVDPGAAFGPMPGVSPQFGGMPSVGGDPFGGRGIQVREQPFGMPAQSGGNPFGGGIAVGGNPFGNAAQVGGDPFRAITGTAGDTRPVTPTTPTTNTPGTNQWAGNATSDDNKTLTAEQIDAWIRQTRPNSPLAGMGAYILNAANTKGVSAPQMLGIMLKESELGTTAGPNMNLGGITDPAKDQGLGNTRAFDPNSSWQEAIDDIANNLATNIYKGKSLAEQIGAWYVGPEEYARNGLNATDKAGNGTVADYLALVSQVYQALGIPLNAQTAPQRAAPVGAGAFPVEGYNQKVHTHWDTDERGATDIFAPKGTAVRAMTNGTVASAGYDETGGYYVMIRSDDGTDEYYAHLYAPPTVQAGQRVTAGWQLGGVGDTGNAAGVGTHLHLGKGYGIISGTGPQGGAGRGFDLITWLEQWLAGQER